MGGFAATALKVPGAISWGKNMAHAKKMIIEAIECAVEGEVIIAAQKSGQISVRPTSKSILSNSKARVLV